MESNAFNKSFSFSALVISGVLDVCRHIQSNAGACDPLCRDVEVSYPESALFEIPEAAAGHKRYEYYATEERDSRFSVHGCELSGRRYMNIA